ncbi:MAG TPA: hypothetical protein VM187_04705 [Niastella sp.]|nr:hypothetical protein [Niastella sp.]
MNISPRHVFIIRKGEEKAFKKEPELTVGDSHEYGLSPDPFDKASINKLILDYLKTFANFKGNTVTATWNGVYSKLTNGERIF